MNFTFLSLLALYVAQLVSVTFGVALAEQATQEQKADHIAESLDSNSIAADTLSSDNFHHLLDFDLQAIPPKGVPKPSAEPTAAPTFVPYTYPIYAPYAYPTLYPFYYYTGYPTYYNPKIKPEPKPPAERALRNRG